QQVRIIQRMAGELNLDTEIVVCPIVREADGLAMSSRNTYLSKEQRKAAGVLYRALKAAAEEVQSGVRDSLALQKRLLRIIEVEPTAKIDYAEIVDAESF